MLVVIPICQKDWDLHLRNLRYLARYPKDINRNHSALIAYDETLEVTALEQVREAVNSVFNTVYLHCYDSPGTTEWPQAANHAWQSVVRYIYYKFKEHNWLWWEADATPLRCNWLDQLEEAHLKCGKEMSGHIVMGMGHMNGVGIYPGNVMELAKHAFKTRQAAFDVVLGSECGESQFPLNHLIYHFPRANGLRVAFTDRDALDELHKRGYVLFHGCTDGTLLDLLERKEPKVEYPDHVRFFTKDDIGKPMDEAEHYWQKEYVKARKKGWDFIPIEKVREEVPSITQQTPWPVDFFELPTRRNDCFMNPGICRDGNGVLWLLVRHWMRRAPKDWHSEILICELFDNLKIKQITPMALTDDVFEQNEDPRALWHDGKFYVSYCSWNQKKIYHARQKVAVFDANWKLLENTCPAYGWNDPEIMTHPEVGVAEKNWVWFRAEENGRDYWHFVYSFMSHAVVAHSGGAAFLEHYTQPKLLWKHGEIRGGTPPILIGDEYLTFFHSSLPWKKKRKRYYMGCYCFEAKPPFAVTRITPEPLLTGSENDSYIHEPPLVVFPGGHLYEDEKHFVVFGVNDEQCAHITIPHVDLEARMVPCN